jgi:hypothetical protein
MGFFKLIVALHLHTKMKVMNAHIRIKALVLLGLTAWLLCFQTYHAITEHWNLFESSHHHCEHGHHHDSEPLSAGVNNPQDTEEDCEICKLISIVPSEIASFSYQLKHTSTTPVLSSLYKEGYFETFVSREFSRGPPALA